MSVDEQVRAGFDNGLVVEGSESREQNDSTEQDGSESLYPIRDKRNDSSQIPLSDDPIIQKQIDEELRGSTQEETVESFKKWLQNKQDKAKDGRPNHSFSVKSANYRLARLYDVDRLVQWDYDNPYTVMITLGAGSFEQGERRPILDVHQQIASSYRTVMRQIDRTLSDKRFARCVIYAPSQERNYAQTHVHIGLWVDGMVQPVDFKSTLDSYVRNTGCATADYHTVEQAVSVDRLDIDTLETTDADTGKGATSRMAKYLGSNLVGISSEGVDVRGSDFHDLLWSACMNAAGRTKFRRSNEFRDLADELQSRRDG